MPATVDGQQGFTVWPLVLTPSTVVPGLRAVDAVALGVPAVLLTRETAPEAAWDGI